MGEGGRGGEGRGGVSIVGPPFASHQNGTFKVLCYYSRRVMVRFTLSKMLKINV